MASYFQIPQPDIELIEKAKKVREAYLRNCQRNNSQRIEALNSIADSLLKNADKILEANLNDFKTAQNKGISSSLLSRLKLTNEKLLDSINGIRKVGQLNDPIGQLQINKELSEGLILQRRSVPIGVIGVIFESRPDAVMQISALAIRSGNSVILKGGSEANNTNIALVDAIKEGLNKSEIDRESICLLTSRKDSMAMLKLEDDINLIVPRGSNELVKFIQENTKIPVLGHADGICHIYLDNEIDLDLAIRVSLDSKAQYPAACNAVETLLIHSDIAEQFLLEAIPQFKAKSIELRGDKRAKSLGVEKSADEEDWKTEYLELILAIKIVDNIDEAIAHIQKFSSKHTDAIITKNAKNAKKFMNLVDSAGVFHNCSTRFADGFRYGFGAEVGISTQSLPPRGPVGLEGLVTYKYFLSGEGQIVENFSSGGDSFTHRDL